MFASTKRALQRLRRARRVVLWFGLRRLRVACRVVASVLLLDLVTKLAAVLAFRPGQTFKPIPGVLVGLTYNTQNLGSHDLRSAASYGMGALLLSGVTLLAASIALALISRRAAPLLRLLAILSALLAPVVVLSVANIPSSIYVATPAVVAVRALAAIGFALAALRLVPSSWLFLGFSLWLGGNLANALNALLSPYGVIDIIHIEALRFRFQMFNFADFSLFLGDLVLLSYPVVRAGRRLSQRRIEVSG